MLLAARANHGPSDGRGVIGHACSPDLRRWQTGPPLSEPGEFFQLEVPMPLTVHGDGSLSVQLPGPSTGAGLPGAAS
jgi:beta-fructofuranosidase